MLPLESPSQQAQGATGGGSAGADILPYVVPMFAYVGLTALEGYLPQLVGKPSPAWYPIAYGAKLFVVVLLAWHYRATWSDFRPRPKAGAIVLGVLTGLFVCAALGRARRSLPGDHVPGKPVGV